MRQAARRRGGVERVPVNVYGAVHHYAVVYIGEALDAYAYIECIKSFVDRHGASGMPHKRPDTECITSLGGAMRQVSVSAIDAVVGPLFLRDRHVILYAREAFTTPG